MKKTRIINLIGLTFLIFLGIVKAFFSEQFSVITTDFGGFICVVIGAALAFYKPRAKQ